MQKMAEERRLVIPGVLDQVPEVCSFVVLAAEAAGLDDRAVYHCQMAVDEWLTNVIEHGYKGHGKRGWIEIVCGVEAHCFKIVVSDDGPPFDPTQLAEVDSRQPLEDRQPGGLGWFFIRKIMDEVHYQFKDGRNHLTMIKNNAQQVEKSGQTDPLFPVHEHQPGLWVMTPSGRLDSTVGRQFEMALNATLAAGRVKLIMDLNQVTYISSSGLKVLIMARKQTRTLLGSFALSGLSPRVHEIFEISGFDSLFSMFSTVEEAAASLQASA